MKWLNYANKRSFNEYCFPSLSIQTALNGIRGDSGVVPHERLLGVGGISADLLVTILSMSRLATGKIAFNLCCDEFHSSP